MTQTIIVEKSSGGVASLTFNRPEKLNAFSATLVEEVTAAMREFRDDDDVRAVVVSGAGRAFSAGFDLEPAGPDLEPAGPDQSSSSATAQWKFGDRTAFEFQRSFWDLPKPVIAAVHGYCLGGAFEVALACDLTIAAEGSKFGEPEIRLGYGSAFSVLTTYVLPMKVARELLYSGSLIEARRAYEVGLVNAVVPADTVLERAHRQAELLAKISPRAMQLTKEAINNAYELAGAMSAIANNRNLAAILGGLESEEDREFARIASSDGVSAALKWRQAQFRELEGDP